MTDFLLKPSHCFCKSMGKQKCPIHKVCLKCGHPVCPHCGDWCDVFLYKPSDKGFHIENEDNEPIDIFYPIPCCGMECIYE